MALAWAGGVGQGLLSVQHSSSLLHGDLHLSACAGSLPGRHLLCGFSGCRTFGDLPGHGLAVCGAVCFGSLPGLVL